ncbi:uncharacterized protein [Misgurnus anguillicaudatus]|uniref:uncharacterized protein isoform X2 n=1 Tax=Misgurnus anguillicaudatus TaxID=75329 RepID=UPI003CCFBDBD
MCLRTERVRENHTFQEMWELYCQYSAQKDRPDDFGTTQRDLIQKAYSSVSRWLNTPITHITSVEMKRFRKYIYDRKTQMSSSSISDPSWLDDTHLFEVIKSEAMASTASSGAPSSLAVQSSSTAQASFAATPAKKSSTAKVPVETLQSDSPVDLEGWVRLWENPNGISPADLSWVKEDTERGLFGPIQVYRNKDGIHHICDISS